MIRANSIMLGRRIPYFHDIRSYIYLGLRGEEEKKKIQISFLHFRVD